MEQSRGLRESASVRDAVDRAKSYNLALNLVMDLSDRLTLTSHTAWNWDSVYSVQDDNRFNTVPIFSDTSNLVTGGIFDGIITPSEDQGLAPGGILCDPQIGCSKTLGVFDISSADSKQFAQELRLQSSFDGPFNFSIGGNYTKFRTQNDYYVMSNILTAIARLGAFGYNGETGECEFTNYKILGAPNFDDILFCRYIDQNPVEDIDCEGHNYIRSSNTN